MSESRVRGGPQVAKPVDPSPGPPGDARRGPHRYGEEALGHAPRTSLLVASEPITIRFPSGAWEYVVTERVPEAGDTLVRDGKTWTVAGVTESVDGHRVVTMAPEVVEAPTLASLASAARARQLPTSSPGRARRRPLAPPRGDP